MNTLKEDSAQNVLSQDLVVVGFGSSAGGLETYKSILPQLPADQNLAYVIVQHLDPKQKSMMTSILSSYTDMEIVEAADSQRISPGIVYLTPPNTNIWVQDNSFKLGKPPTTHAPKPSVDYFFKSLAEQMPSRSVGIILSGTGTDGAHGIRAIKGGGGFTMVQDPKTTKYDGMPQAALQTGIVDLIVTPEQIGDELYRLIHKVPHVVEEKDSASEEEPIDAIVEALYTKTGSDFSGYKKPTLRRRIYRRMALHEVGSVKEYLEFLQSNDAEAEQLFKDILISVTSFFRDQDSFEALRPYLEAIKNSKQPRDQIRIWVPGCATGEEAYSIAILLAEILGNDAKKQRIHIFGTDLDGEAIEVARRGIYSEASVADLDEEIQSRYFWRFDNSVKVRDFIRDMVVFSRHDILKDPPFMRIDLISCRNLLIYFDTTFQSQIIPLFFHVLNSSGYLFIGQSESINKFSSLFTCLEKKAKIYQKNDSATAPSPNLGRFSVVHGLSTPRSKKAAKSFSARDTMLEAIASTFTDSAILVNQDFDILYVRGDLHPYAGIPSGEPGWNVIEAVHAQLRLDLRTMLHRCLRDNETQVSKPILISEEEPSYFARIRVSPVLNRNVRSKPHMALILFEPVPEAESDPGAKRGSDQATDDKYVRDLEQELTATKERLQTTVEELETSNEELMSLNEELQSTNEELQSSNEELETSNEELQSSNEELNTVNEELNAKSAELANTLADLENILRQIDLPLVIVDEAFRVKRFTPQAKDVFDINDEKLGGSLLNLNRKFTLQDLGSQLTSVLENNTSRVLEVRTESKVYLLRIVPYHDLKDASSVEGLLLIFIDKTEITRTQLELSGIGKISKMFLENQDSNHVYQNLPHLLASHFGYRYAGINLLDDSEEFLTNLGNVDGPYGLQLPPSIPRNEALVKHVLDDNTCIVETRASERQDIADSYLSQLNLETIIMVPIQGSTTHGILILADTKERKEADQLLSSLQIIANHLAMELERCLAEKASKQKQSFIQKITDTAPFIIYIFDLQERSHIFINQRVELVLGYTPQRIRTIDGRFIEDVVHDEDKEALRAHLSSIELDASNEIYDIEIRMQTQNGEYRLMHLREIVFSRDESSGSPLQVLGTAEDVTDKKNHEEMQLAIASAKAANEAKNQFLAKMSHELRTPISGILGMSELLKSRDISDSMAENVDMIHASAETLLRIVNDLIDLSKMEAQKLDLEVFDFDLRELVRLVIGSFQSQLKNKDVRLESEMDGSVPPVLKGDKFRLEQVLNNLLSNAIKHTSEGEIRLRVEVLEKESDRITLQFSVADTGPGIAASRLDSVFESGLYGERTQHAPSRGLGLGLSIAKQLVNMMDGEIWARSREGEGSTFYFSAKFGIAAKTSIDKSEARSQTSLADLPQLHLLLAEDSKMNQIFLVEFFKDAGHTVEIAQDGAEALQLLREHSFDLVIMDIQMPRLDGSEAAERIRSGHEEGIDPHVPIIALTAYARQEEIETIEQSGIDSVVTKPVDIQHLSEEMRKLLSGKRHLKIEN